MHYVMHRARAKPQNRSVNKVSTCQTSESVNKVNPLLVWSPF